MADRQLQAILSSGEITSMNIGGTTSSNAVATLGDIAPSIVAVGTLTSLTAQTLTASVPAKLTYFNTEIVAVGSAVDNSIPNQQINITESGSYKISGTIELTDGNANEVHTITLYVNGVATPFRGSRSGDGSITFIGASTYSAGDDLELYITSTSTSITVVLSSIIVEKI